MLEKTVPQLKAHHGRNVGEIESSGDPGAMQAYAQRVKGFTAAAQHQLPQQLGPDAVSRVIRGSQLLDGEFAPLNYAARSQSVDQRELSGRDLAGASARHDCPHRRLLSEAQAY
jgi:hypothetical protein